MTYPRNRVLMFIYGFTIIIMILCRTWSKSIQQGWFSFMIEEQSSLITGCVIHVVDKDCAWTTQSLLWLLEQALFWTTSFASFISESSVRDYLIRIKLQSSHLHLRVMPSFISLWSWPASTPPLCVCLCLWVIDCFVEEVSATKVSFTCFTKTFEFGDIIITNTRCSIALLESHFVAYSTKLWWFYLYFVCSFDILSRLIWHKPIQTIIFRKPNSITYGSLWTLIPVWYRHICYLIVANTRYWTFSSSMKQHPAISISSQSIFRWTLWYILKAGEVRISLVQLPLGRRIFTRSMR